MRAHLSVLVAVLAGFLLGLLFIVGIREFRRPGSPEATAAPTAAEVKDDLLPVVAPPADATVSRRTPVVEAVARAAPAVVSITTEVASPSPFFHYSKETSTSEGSGAVVRADGVVLTNAHVVSGALSMKATFEDGTSYKADVLGLDENLDLAVLKLDGVPGNLPTIPLGTSSDLILGEPVIAIGNPFGLGHTVTTGVVSSTSRTLEVADRVFQDYIQTDAGINPGNSGGPLLNIRGELIGINCAIRRDAENIGFAIPVDRAAKVARDLLRYGSVRAPWLGVTVEDIGGPRYARTAFADGAVVVTRVDAQAATNAGLVEGDIIVEVDGRPVHSRDDLNLHLAASKPGDEVQVKVVRKNQTFTFKMVADSVPSDTAAHLVDGVLGITVTPLDAANARTFGLRKAHGLLVTQASPKGTFVAAGLRAGDLIVAVNGVDVRTEEDLRNALVLARSAHRGMVLLTVLRGAGGGYVKVAL